MLELTHFVYSQRKPVGEMEIILFSSVIIDIAISLSIHSHQNVNYAIEKSKNLTRTYSQHWLEFTRDLIKRVLHFGAKENYDFKMLANYGS